MQISRKEAFSIQLLQIVDALLVLLAFWVAGLLADPIRETLGSSEMREGALGPMNWVLFIMVPFTPLVLERFEFYRHPVRKTTRRAVWQLVQGMLVLALFVGLIAVFAQLLDPRRLAIGLSGVFMFGLLLGRDRALRSWLLRRQLSHNGRERVVVAGSGEEMQELLDEIDPEIRATWNVVAMFDLSVQTVDDLYVLLKQESVERVLFAAKHTEFDRVARAVEACELQGVEAWIAASFIRTQVARPVFDSVGARPMLVLRSTPELSWELLVKEVFDRIGALVLIVLTAPLWLIAAIGIRLSSPGGPVLFCQKRAGRYGMPFRMWKFRTMVPNAEALLNETKKTHGNQMGGPVFKLDRDPRVFAFGALLRRLSIDELPQLINVLRGEISLVGPRPLPLYEVEAFSELAHRRRLSVKPGITCEWQAGGRNTITSFEQWVEMDLRYIDNWSLWLDFKILARTVPAVIFGRGAK
jgi:exopolysaccharide biosynthesis polyprenyl glycosylphosphotransferase